MELTVKNLQCNTCFRTLDICRCGDSIKEIKSINMAENMIWKDIDIHGESIILVRYSVPYMVDLMNVTILD